MPKPAALTKVLLNVLSHLTETAVELGDLAAAVSTHYGSAYGKGGRAYVTELKRLEQQRVLRRTINRLRDRKFIIARRIGQRLIISLTSKGRTATLINRFQQAKPNVRGVYTVVIFDIPETERTARRQFRLLLRQGGFVRLQQSVWVSRADTYQIVVEFLRQVKLQDWVNVYRATDFFHLPRRLN